MAKIIVADDDPGILDSTKLLLEYVGHEVITTGDGNTVRKIEASLPDVILLDIWLSGANGGEITKKLKANKTTQHIPIILFSANRDIEKIAHEAGADDYLVKPFDSSLLLKKIERHAKECSDTQ